MLLTPQSGIQSLLKTEREAQEIVSEARRYRGERLKAAKADAQGEIEAYKAKKAAELEAFEAQFAGANAQLEKDAEAEAEAGLKEITQLVAQKKDQVVKLLVESVANAKPEMHINA